MSARRFIAGVATASLAASALALTATAPAQADPSAPPTTDDIVGVGSDTSQFALNYLADGTVVNGVEVPGYNDGLAAGQPRLVSFDALGDTGKVVLKEGGSPITRPNGSGAGKNALYSPSNPDVDFARSSSGLSTAEVNAGLWSFPFAKDTLAMAVAGAGSNAPAALTGEQIVDIYDGTVTNWSQLGGEPGVIKPMIPQTGSGTRSFFTGQLQALNGGTAVSLAASVTEVQEHDDAAIKNDPNAIAPFSLGRADLLGTLRIADGWSAARALYNVVRQSDVEDEAILDLFGPEGFVCSPAAAPLITAAGFDQLATPDRGGKCGEATQTSTTDFTLSSDNNTEDPEFVPAADDLVGAGSDTSQFAMDYLAEGFEGIPGYNNGRSSGRLASFAALRPGHPQVVLQDGAAAITRPNGSGAGKNALYNPSNPAVDYARSSSGLSTAEVNAGLWSFPFAKDTLAMAVAGQGSNAPTTLTGADIVKIYDGTYTNWSQVPGSTTTGVIKPMIPQTGSGTRSFFTGQLQALNGGTAVSLAASVTEVQEHDDTAIRNDPNAIAPFSVGRADLLGTLTITDGWSAARALYNVVRQSDVEDEAILDVFGPEGFVCSPAAAPLITAAGFEQLATPANGGKCGEATQSSTTDFDLSSWGETTVATTATATAVPAGGGLARVTTTVEPSWAAGTVELLVDGADNPASTAAVRGGVATRDLQLPAGAHSVVARFVPQEGTPYDADEAPAANVTVAAAVPTSTAVTASSPAGRTIRAVANVSNGATGIVRFYLDDAAPAAVTVPVTDGVATADLQDVAGGDHTVTALFVPTAGSVFGASRSSAATVAVAERTASATSVAVSPAAGTYGRARTVTVTVTGAGGTPTGTVSVKVGSAAAKSVALSGGKATLAVPATTPAGNVGVVATYAGDDTFAGSNGNASLVVAKAASRTTESFKAAVRAASAKGKVKVVLVGSTLKPTGKVTVRKGARTVATGTLRNGLATLTLKGLKKGKNAFTVSYAGNGNVKGSATKLTVTRK